MLAGTEIEPILAFLSVRYPHRKTRDLYVPPANKESRVWHCCQENCPQPEFEGGVAALLKHLEVHAGKLIKRLPPVASRERAVVVVRLPPNPWAEGDSRGVNPDRRFVVSLYISSVCAALRKRGIWPLETKAAQVEGGDK